MDPRDVPLERVPNAPTSALWTPEGEPGAPLVVSCARCGEDLVLPPPEKGLVIPSGAALTHDVCPRDQVLRRFAVRLRVVEQRAIALPILFNLTASIVVDLEDVAGFQVVVEARTLQAAIAGAGAGLSEKWNRLHVEAGLADESAPA